MSQYNKLSDIQYERFEILPVDFHFGLFWSAGIPNMHRGQCGLVGNKAYSLPPMRATHSGRGKMIVDPHYHTG